MADEDEAIANLATGLNADFQHEKSRREPDQEPEPLETSATLNDIAYVEADHVGEIAPPSPGKGESWYKPSSGKLYYWHGMSWYMTPPEAEADEEQPIEVDAEPDEEETGPEEAVELDSEGKPWNPELHSPKKTKNKDGTWRAKKGAVKAADEPAQEVEPAEELKTEMETISFVDTNDDHAKVETAAEEPEIIFEFDTAQLVADARDAMLEQFKHRPKPWSAMSEEEQRDCAAALQYASEQMVRGAVELIAADQEGSVRCLLESYAEKDGIKVILKVQAFGPEEGERAVVFLHNARGGNVMLSKASIDDYRGDREAEIEPDQPEIEWDAEPYEGDDADLAGDDFEEASEEELAAQAERPGHKFDDPGE